MSSLNSVNSVKLQRWTIPSQAQQECCEGVTTRSESRTDNNPSTKAGLSQDRRYSLNCNYNREVYIYLLSDPITNQIRYVGKTTNPHSRYYEHTRPGNVNHIITHKNCWIKSLRAKGLKPILEVIDIVSEAEWQFWEEYWICQIKAWGFDLTNMTLGGEGALGVSKKNSFKHTEEAKAKIAAKNKAIKKTPEWIARVAEGSKKSILQYSLNGEFIKEWDSASNAALQLTGNKENKKNISAVCRKTRNKAYGYKWSFK